MKTLTYSELINLFDICPNTGKFFWKNVSKHHKSLNGKEAGCIQKTVSGKKYHVIKINGKKYKRGRLMFFYVFKNFPKPCVDHINGNSLDDRIENLREASILENAWNHKNRKKTSKLPMGIRLTKNNKYQARISFMGKLLHLGIFENVEDAHNCYQLKRKELYGKFA